MTSRASGKSQTCNRHVRQETACLEGAARAFLGVKSRAFGGSEGAVVRWPDWHSDDGEKCEK